MSVVSVQEFPGFETAAQTRTHVLGLPFDRIDFETTVAQIAQSLADAPLRNVVTPNVDHVVKTKRDGNANHVYQDAWLSLCDSRPILAMSRLLGTELFHVTGSDLTARLFREVVQPGDRITLIVASDAIAAGMLRTYPHLAIRAHVPPMGVARDPAAFRECVEFALAERARFIFIGIGAPQSEIIAHALARDPRATGIALCTGASLEFMLGLKRRAPRWMQSLGLEWLHRLLSEPRRLWRRYVLGVVPLVRLFLADMRQRRSVPQDLR